MGDKKKTRALNIFISYSHKDTKFKESLQKNLKVLEKDFNISTWHDGRILTGDNVDNMIKQQLDNSNVVLLLVSTNFLASYYCMEIEVENAIKKMEKGKCVVVPVILKKCDLTSENIPFSRLNRVPRDGRPISTYRPIDDGCLEATNMIREMLEKRFPNSKKENQKSKSGESGKKIEDVGIKLYKNGKLKPIPVDQDFLDSIPKYMHGLAELDRAIRKKVLPGWVKEYKNDFSKYKNNSRQIHKKRQEVLKMFLMEICSYLKMYLTDYVGIRIHFRGLNKKGTHYIGIIASTIKSDSDDLATDWRNNLTPIPVKEGLIYHSWKLRSGLLKSLNSRLNLQTKSSKIWVEYLTYTFTKLGNNKGYPILSMGISVDKKFYLEKKNLFCFLAYIGIGEYVEEWISEYCQRCKRIDPLYNLDRIVQ